MGTLTSSSESPDDESSPPISMASIPDMIPSSSF
jgi:hypothetical protein